jgi:hypothetical protein
MEIFGYTIGKTMPNLKASNEKNAASPGGDVWGDARFVNDDSIFKGYIPTFLYKPPFGYPRSENIPLIKAMAKNPYIHAVITTLQEEAAWNKWEIVPADPDEADEFDQEASSEGEDDAPADVEKKEATVKARLKAQKDKRKSQQDAAKKIKNFLNNPNENPQGFSHLVKCAVRDICEIDAAVWVKVFNQNKEFTQLSILDGGSMLKNPDIHGNIGKRKEIVFPTDVKNIDTFGMQEQIKYYNLYYKEQAAYFQYGWTVASLPVPFGKREIIYFMKNPRSDNIYGTSPVMILTDILLTLIYGARYNLDFYLNSNMPEGIIQMLGANATQMNAFNQRMQGQIMEDDKVTGFKRRIGYKLPVTNTQADFIPFQFNSKDMQILEQQAWFTKLVWMAFGISEQDMGILENSNRSTSQTMFKQYARKAVRPILELIAERINQQIIPEFGDNGLMFKWDDYDLDEDIKRHQLYLLQSQLGIKTAEMIAAEENIDVEKLKESKAEQQKLDAEHAQAMGEGQDTFAGQRTGGDGKFGSGKQPPKSKSPKTPTSKTYDRPDPSTKSSHGSVTPLQMVGVYEGDQGETDEEKAGFAQERKEHPGLTDGEVLRLVRDHIQIDSKYYSKEVETKDIVADRQMVVENEVRGSVQIAETGNANWSLKGNPLGDKMAQNLMKKTEILNSLLDTYEKGNVNNIQ